MSKRYWASPGLSRAPQKPTNVFCWRKKRHSYFYVICIKKLRRPGNFEIQLVCLMFIRFTLVGHLVYGEVVLPCHGVAHASRNVAGDTFERQSFAYLGHKRYRDPKFALLAEVISVAQLDSSLILELSSGNAVLSATTVYAVVKGLVATSTSGDNLDLYK